MRDVLVLSGLDTVACFAAEEHCIRERIYGKLLQRAIEQWPGSLTFDGNLSVRKDRAFFSLTEAVPENDRASTMRTTTIQLASEGKLTPIDITIVQIRPLYDTKDVSVTLVLSSKKVVISQSNIPTFV